MAPQWLMLLWLGCLVVGILGGVLGVGGGVFLVPLLVVVAELRPVEAVAVSLFCVIGTSAGALSRSLPGGEANLGLALFLEPPLLLGAVGASLVAHRVADRGLMLGFSVLLLAIGLQVATSTLRRRAGAHATIPTATATATAPPAVAHWLAGVSSGVAYRPVRLPLVWGLMVLAGAASGLFGIGGGAVAVPVLAFAGRVPLKAAAATTTVSLMVTAAAAAMVHDSLGPVPGRVIAIALAGVLPGGLLGARLQHRVSERTLRLTFAALASGTAVLTAARALAGWAP
jgi:uncharacterized membrane protein YfcA